MKVCQNSEEFMVLNSIMGQIKHQQVQQADVEDGRSTGRQDTARSDERRVAELGSVALEPGSRDVYTPRSSALRTPTGGPGQRAQTSVQGSRLPNVTLVTQSDYTPRAQVSTFTAGTAGQETHVMVQDGPLM